ncbi:helix-turn-helix domain-containing protein [Mycolicibacterium sp. 050232]|uniref:TetR/AcrR family transcriptional regulator n=1 Tax=Mycolicibacterium sp. 050232 TaxID=3113982 RepID=UPI002E2BD0EB|nr:helix-turn-helix domain-containing protein [Mycolicibacterium sp. 050232]MED5812607.1 helix-turn-helix domain-containing protein [Mycolicibacterium sp. 050232]
MTASSPQLGRPVGASGEVTRERITAAAMRCVAEVGYAKATIRAIARTAEMTSGSLYHYFSNKSDLLDATVTRIEEIAVPRLRAAAGSRTDVIERLEAVLDASGELMREYPHLAAFEQEMRMAGSALPLHSIFREVIGDAQRHGALSRDVDVQGAADALYALSRGLTAQAASLSPDTFHATTEAAKRLIRGILLPAHGE